MPLIQKTIYIRPEDIEAWERVPNKAAFIHEALKTNTVTTVQAVQEPIVTNSYPDIDKPVKPPQKSLKTATESFTPQAPDPELGYPCCQQAKPCKHWGWNELKLEWVNQLTGKTREAI